VRTITRKVYYTYGESYIIKPVFDVHWGATACDENAFRAFLEDSDDKTLFLFGGDLFDAIIVNDRRYRKSKDKTISDAIIDENVNEMVDILKPYADRIIGIGSGNHEDTIVKNCGTDPIGRLCKHLNVENLGYSGLIRLMFSTKTGRGRKVIIRYHHGWGGGSRTQGADLTKFSKDMSYWQRETAIVIPFGIIRSLPLASPELPRGMINGQNTWKTSLKFTPGLNQTRDERAYLKNLANQKSGRDFI